MGRPAAAYYCAALCLCFLCVLQCCAAVPVLTSGTDDGMERWGYVQVRPKAHLFWWYYKSPQRASAPPGKPWPTVLWLQGGPGASGVGTGNFLEVGPLGVDLNPRDSTWLRKADFIFVDNPVGVGYSYVEDDDSSLLVTTDWEAAADMTTVLEALVDEVPTLRSSPLFLVAESYGGKYAATLGVSIARAVDAGELNITLGGVALGDSFISPVDFSLSYGPLLRDVSRLDDAQADEANRQAEVVSYLVEAGLFAAAQTAWGDQLRFIANASSHVDAYNFLLDGAEDPVHPVNYSSSSSSSSGGAAGPLHLSRYSAYIARTTAAAAAAGGGNNTTTASSSVVDLLNGAVKEKLKIIPKDLVWKEINFVVYHALINDMMKPRIDEIDELLERGVNVTVYNGQLDVICSTMGAEAWVKKLKWDGLNSFLNTSRQPLYCGPTKATQAFVRSYRNLHFYWILGAGHFVPYDQPCVALNMIGSITQSPAP